MAKEILFSLVLAFIFLLALASSRYTEHRILILTKVPHSSDLERSNAIPFQAALPDSDRLYRKHMFNVGGADSNIEFALLQRSSKNYNRNGFMGFYYPHKDVKKINHRRKREDITENALFYHRSSEVKSLFPVPYHLLYSGSLKKTIERDQQ